MANEIRGKLYETITYKALEGATVLAGIQGKVDWNKTPEGMSVEPDFTIGADEDRPDIVVMVTASGSTRDSEKKSWRNLGELQEIKAQLPSVPRVLNLYFISEMKKELADATNRLYDATIHVQEKPYHKEFDRWVSANSKNVSKSRDEKVNILEEALATDAALAAALSEFVQDLAKAMKQENKDLKPLWVLMREDYLKPRKVPDVKRTSVRRGLGKLLILEPELRRSVYGSIENSSCIDLERVPQYAFDLKLLSPTIGGAIPFDSEMLSVIELLGADLCERTLARAPDSMSNWIEPLRELDKLAKYVAFVAEHYTEICKPSSLVEMLRDCYNNPSQLSGCPDEKKLWLYNIMSSLLKAKSGKRQGYGYAQLASDTEISELQRGLHGLFFTPFIQREKMIDERSLCMLAEGLAKRFAIDIDQKQIQPLLSKVVDSVVQENLEDRLLPYRNFEPLLWLLESELEKQGKPYEGKTSYVGWINEYSGIGKRVATTPFVKAGHCLIHWKSSYAGHPNDKTKELSARVRSVRFCYGSDMFSHRNGIEKFALVVDGDWTKKHLETLSQAGWDVIIYPDEIPVFVSSL